MQLLPSLSSTVLSCDQLRDIRVALLLGLAAIDGCLSPSLEAVDTTDSLAVRRGCLEPILGGLEASGHFRILRRLTPDHI